MKLDNCSPPSNRILNRIPLHRWWGSWSGWWWGSGGGVWKNWLADDDDM